MTLHEAIALSHAAVGTLALASFWLAAAFRKGSPRHRLVGKIYLLAMVGILATGVPLAAQRFVAGQVTAGAFLAFLLLLTTTTVWASWRSIRDKHDPARYTGGIYRAFALANIAGGASVVLLGLREGDVLLAAFPLLGVLGGIDMLRKRARLARQPRWWITEHYSAMLGNGVATHIAFLAIGLPRLLPQIDGELLHHLAWFGPVAVMLVARVLLDRRWKAASDAAPRPKRPSPAAARSDALAS
jgi:hypothetical protein